MFNTGVYPTYTLHVKNIWITHESSTHVIPRYVYACNIS